MRKSVLWPLAFMLFSCSNQDSKAAKPAGTSPIVTVLQIEAKDTPVTYEYVAQTQSSHQVNIQARVNGFLDKIIYTEGEFVKAGQVLFIMDKRPFEAQVDAAEAALAKQQAALENARLNLDRVQPLTELNALSQKDLDDAIGSFQTNGASVDQAKAQLDTAQLNLSYCTIIAPFDGITSAALKQEGSYLSVSDSLLTTISSLSPIWVNFSISENQMQAYSDQAAKGQLIIPSDEEFDVQIIQVNGAIFPYTGKITFREPYYNSQTGTFLIRASVDNPDKTLRPNQFVRARIEGAIRPKAILIPQRAVLQSSKGHYVWVITSENNAEFRPVKVGDWQGDNWFILEGLQSGERVAVDGIMTLRPGLHVEVEEIQNTKASAPNTKI